MADTILAVSIVVIGTDLIGFGVILVMMDRRYRAQHGKAPPASSNVPR
jgi:hypothetical protein